MTKKRTTDAKAAGRAAARSTKTTGRFVSRSTSRKSAGATPVAKKASTGRFVSRERTADKSVILEQPSEATSGGRIEIDPLQVKIAVITEALRSNAKTAEFLGVARSQPGRWLTGQERPNPRARRLIQDFEYVWDRLTDDRTSEGAHLWLRSGNAFLNGATPLTWLKTRGPDDVIAAIDAEEAGSYA